MEVKYYTEQAFSPTAMEVLGYAKEQVFGNREIEFVPVDTPANDVLCFGVSGGIRTLSPKQIATAANSLSALVQAFELVKYGPLIEDTTDWAVNPDTTWITDRFDVPLTWDIEHDKDRNLLCLGVTDGDSVAIFNKDYKKVAEALAQCYYLQGWNVKYDSKIVYWETGVRIGNFFDGMLAHHTVNIAATGQHGLATVAQRMLGVNDWEADSKKWAGTGKNTDYGKIPQDVLHKYNAQDVFYTHVLCERLAPDVVEDESFWLRMSAADLLLDVECGGVGVDVPYIKELDEEFTEDISQAKARLPEGINPNSPKQLLSWLNAEGVMVSNTSAGTLEEHVDHPQIEALLEYRKATKIKGTYVDSYLANHRDGTLFPTFNVHGTTTGRLSSSNPNAQNVPSSSKIRKIFQAREDKVLVGADYSQAELRSMSMLSGCEVMQSLFQPGMPDYFDSMLPIAFPQLFTTIKDVEALRERDEEQASQLRRQLKTVIFGLSYGRGARAIGKTLGMPQKDAQQIIDDIMEGQPGFAQWRQDVMEAAVNPAKRDMLTTPFGRKFQSEVVTWRNKDSVQRAALSFLPQSTASDLTLVSAVRLNKKVPGQIVLLVHDEIIVECEESVAKEVAGMMEFEMVNTAREVFGDTIEFKAEAAIGQNWGEL